MDLNAKINIHNKFEVTVCDKDSGEVKQTAYAENIVLDAMYARLCNFSSFFDYMFFGTGTGTLSASRTSLFAHLGYKAFTATDCGTVEEIKNFPTMSRKRRITIQPEEHVGKTITEVGIAYGSSNSNLVTHAILDTPIIKTATDIVVIDSTIYFSFGEWQTGFYGGNVRWRPAMANDLVNYLFGTAVMPSEYFKVGTDPFITSAVVEGLLASSSAIANTGWTKDVANKKVTTPVTRIAASAGNGAIKTFGLGSSDTKGVFTAILPLTGVFENYAITGEAVGTGDGATTGFDLAWDDIDSVSKVYLDGVEVSSSDYSVEEKIGRYFFNSCSAPELFGQSGSAYVWSYGSCLSPDEKRLVVVGDSFNPALLTKNDFCFSVEQRLVVGYSCSGAAFSGDGKYLCISHSSSPFVTVYKNNEGTFIKEENVLPNLPQGNASCIAFSKDGTYLVTGHTISQGMAIYKRSADVFTKLSNPSYMPPSNINNVSFSNDGTYLAVTLSVSPYVVVYKRSGDTFTKIDFPDVTSLNSIYGVSFSSCGTYLAVSHYFTPFITIFKRDGDVFTKLPNPSSPPLSISEDLCFSPDTNYLVVSCNSSPYLLVYKRTGDAFIQIDNAFDVNPGGKKTNIVFSSDGSICLVAGNGYPGMWPYKVTYDYIPSQAHNIEFTTAPAAGVAITADYTIDYIPKDANHVLDLSATIQWG